MSRIQGNGDIGKIDKPEDFQRFASIALQDIYTVINGNIEFDLNIRSKTISVSFDAANTEVAVRHGLGRKPIGYLIAASNAATMIYNTSDAGLEVIYLKSSAVAIVKVIVF